MTLRGMLLCLIFLLAAPFSAFALETSHVIDEINVLSESEINNLQQAIDQVSADHGLDLVFVITDNVQGKASRDFADDYYDDNGYGIGEEASGFLMLVNMADREVWISTAGNAIDIFTDQRLDSINDAVVEHLAEGRFFQAGQTFVDMTDQYARAGVPAGQFREEAEPQSYFGKVLRMMTYWPIYVFGLMVSGISTFALSTTHKEKTAPGTGVYIPLNSFVLTDSKDQFLRESVNRVKIANTSSTGSFSSGSGKSSVHRSSSGRSHGGRGKKF